RGERAARYRRDVGDCIEETRLREVAERTHRVERRPKPTQRPMRGCALFSVRFSSDALSPFTSTINCRWWWRRRGGVRRLRGSGCFRPKPSEGLEPSTPSFPLGGSSRTRKRRKPEGSGEQT